MEFYKMYLTCVLMILISFFSSTQAYKFWVGGKDGWVVNPHESYNHWAERNRFQVNDTLYFKYKNQADSVLIVNKDSYNICNTTNPVDSLKDGESSEFKFDRSGPFYFISGNATDCQKGKKLVVVVLAVRRPKSPPSIPTPAISPSPSDYPPSPDAEAPAPSPSKSAAPTVFERPMVMIWGLSLFASVMLGSFVV